MSDVVSRKYCSKLQKLVFGDFDKAYAEFRRAGDECAEKIGKYLEDFAADERLRAEHPFRYFFEKLLVE